MGASVGRAERWPTRRSGSAEAANGDEVFRQLVLARIIEPTSKQDSLRVLAEAGVEAVSYTTLKRRLPVYAEDGFRAETRRRPAPPRQTGPGVPGVVRRVHAVFRNRCRGRVP